MYALILNVILFSALGWKGQWNSETGAAATGRRKKETLWTGTKGSVECQMWSGTDWGKCYLSAPHCRV